MRHHSAPCPRSSIRLGKAIFGGAAGTLYQRVPLRNVGTRPCVVPSATAYYVGASGRRIGAAADPEPGLGGPALISPRSPGALIVGVGEPANYPTGRCDQRAARQLRIRLADIGRFAGPTRELVCSTRRDAPNLRLYGSGGSGDHAN